MILLEPTVEGYVNVRGIANFVRAEVEGQRSASARHGIGILLSCTEEDIY